MKRISDIKINIPKFPKLIIDKLESEGFEAYIVGGCVRDALLGKVPYDYDITTNAKPEDVKKVFRKTIDTGIKHGTVTVLFYEDNKPFTYEVTTFRVDGEYDDARHPKNVLFVNNLKEDLLRRDFTINAMAYNNTSGLIDEFGGLIDLDKRIVRAVGNPTERFTEDALRLLRAIRFSAKLGFKIEEDTKNSLISLANRLQYVSKERIQVEITKILTSKNPDYIYYVFLYGLSKYVCDRFDCINVGKFKENLPIHLAYSCLFYNTNVEDVLFILKNLKFDNNNIYKIRSLLEAKTIYYKITEYNKQKKWHDEKVAIKILINYLGYELVYDFIELVSINEDNDKISSRIKTIITEFENCNTPIFIKDLKIDGNDLINIGFKGAEVGTALNEVLKFVHKNSSFNDRKLLQDICKKAYNKYKGV